MWDTPDKEQPRLGMPRGVVQASLCRGVLESSSPGTEVKVMGLVRPELSLAELLSSPCLLDCRVNTARLVLFQNTAPSWQAHLELKHQAAHAEKPPAFVVKTHVWLSAVVQGMELINQSMFACCRNTKWLHRGWFWWCNAHSAQCNHIFCFWRVKEALFIFLTFYFLSPRYLPKI